MSGLLIAVKSCQRDQQRGDHQVIRETWGRDALKWADVRFFMGGHGLETNCLHDSGDETWLRCEDDYDSLPYKTREICRWFLNTEKRFVFLCDTDTFIIPQRLVASGYVQYDYSGRFGTTRPIGTTFEYNDGRGIVPNCHPYASGGIGYFLSRRAAYIIAQADPGHWAEDLWTGICLGPHIQDGDITAGDLFEFECSCSWHFPRRTKPEYQFGYDPKFGWMEKMQREHWAQ